jgi:hypothetical protein
MFTKAILKRLESLEEYLGVRYAERTSGVTYDYDEHLETPYGLIKRLEDRVKALEKQNG